MMYYVPNILVIYNGYKIYIFKSYMQGLDKKLHDKFLRD